MITELIPFEETLESRLMNEVDELRLSLDKCRRKQFAEISILKKQMMEIRHEHEDWKASICKGADYE